MEIHIRRNGKRMGPYSLEEVRGALAGNELTLVDEAWHPGLHGWTPLGSALQRLEGDTRSPSRTTANGPLATRTSPASPRRPVGCCGWIVLGVLALLVISVIGGLIVGDSGRWENDRIASGILTIKVKPVDRPGTVGNDIAQKVYDVAHDHPELHRLIINVDFYPALMTDKYGHEAKGPLRMGTLTVNDLDEVRRYTIDGAYMGENKGAFAEQVSHMEYAEYLTM